MRNYIEQGLLAHRLAEEIHESQKDKCGEPYMGHVLRVASAAMKHVPQGEAARHYANDLGAKLYIVGVLHDTVEDCDDRFRTEIEQQIILEQGTEIYLAVDAITHKAWVSEPYKEYIARVKSNMLATEVKLEDLRDNFNPERALKLATFAPEQFTRVVDVLIPRYIRAYDYLTH